MFSIASVLLSTRQDLGCYIFFLILHQYLFNLFLCFSFLYLSLQIEQNINSALLHFFSHFLHADVVEFSITSFNFGPFFHFPVVVQYQLHALRLKHIQIVQKFPLTFPCSLFYLPRAL